MSVEQIAVAELPIPELHCQEKSHHFRATLASGQPIYFGMTPGTDWVDVYARRRRAGERAGVFTGAYDCFGFSLSGRRWSFGSGPPAASEIRAVLELLLKERCTRRDGKPPK